MTARTYKDCPESGADSKKMLDVLFFPWALGGLPQGASPFFSIQIRCCLTYKYFYFSDLLIRHIFPIKAHFPPCLPIHDFIFCSIPIPPSGSSCLPTSLSVVMVVLVEPFDSSCSNNNTKKKKKRKATRRPTKRHTRTQSLQRVYLHSFYYLSSDVLLSFLPYICSHIIIPFPCPITTTITATAEDPVRQIRKTQATNLPPKCSRNRKFFVFSFMCVSVCKCPSSMEVQEDILFTH